MPDTRDASASLAVGTTTVRRPFARAASTDGRTPGTGRSRPSSPSSPDVHDAVDRGGVDHPLGDEHGDGDAEIEAPSRASAAPRARGSR